ncbi:MAG: GntR family transcriptional regulator [Pseudonocardia sp.]
MGAAEPDERPASRRVADVLRAEIDAGRYRPGDQLPSYRALATTYDVAVNTAQSAVRLLMADGRVTVRQSAGTYVAEPGRDDESTIVAVERRELADLQRQVQRARRALAEIDRTVNELSGRRAGVQPEDLSESAP